jgi:CDP-diacylglycerol--glycerol-3-phosphate 3-phosphatidyltransferase
MNLPNKLSFARLILTFVFVVVTFAEPPFWRTLALVLFVVASITDYYDGMIARRDNLITNFGILFDPLADKILTCSAFIAFVGMHPQQMPAWMVVVIVARELAITGLRLLASSKQITLAAEKFGKHKTISQIVAIIAVLVLLAHGEWGRWSELVFGWWIGPFTEVAKWVAVILTMFSGAMYLWRNREIYLSDR